MPNDGGIDSWLPEYRALTAGVGIVDCTDRTQIELAGNDRAMFLHNVCTQEVRKLGPLAGGEAFLLDVKGHVLSHGFIFSAGESLVWETVPGEAEKLLRHLDRYLVREKVTLSDRGAAWGAWLAAGPQAAELLSRATGCDCPTEMYASVPAKVAGREVWLRRVPLIGPEGLFVDARREDLSAVRDALIAAGAVPCGADALNAARIEAGSPLYGSDVSEKSLPQEVRRDSQALNFKKGCYLGQETVARIDALGHVNRRLVGVRFEAATVPPRGTQLKAGDQVAGEVTSSAWSPRLGAPLALAYVRREHPSPGAELTSEFGRGTLVALPVV